jgi:penicillin amidase
LGRAVGALVLIVLLVIAFFAANIAIGMRTHARYDGTISGLSLLRAPVSILRDDRGVPHIIASNERDLFFAQGYAEGQDRLFQMDLLRRFVKGQLAEVFGAQALRSDERERAIPVRAIVDAQWGRLDPSSRQVLGAFSDGVNAAIAHETLPVEFRVLAYRPAPWSPEDSLAVSMATVLDLIDDWNDIEPRDAAYRQGGAAMLESEFPLSDPCYDAPVAAGLSGIAPGTACRLRTALRELAPMRPPVGSNGWAAGARRTVTGRALLANDPHLRLGIPGVWYLADLRAPGLHVAGATFPGAPGIVLGHTQNVAWGATDATVASLSVFKPPKSLDARGWQTETFHVRFAGSPVTQRYYRTARDFGVTTKSNQFVLVRWRAYEDPVSPAQTFLALDRARSIEDATRALAAFPGPSHNFVVADTGGRAAYVLAGAIPNDPVWARWFHPASDLAKRYGIVPLWRLPRVPPSRDAIVWTANNRMYAAGYPLRLSPQFAAPYRAYRIAQLLRARNRYDVAYFAGMQMDALSLPEREMARELAPVVASLDATDGRALASWDGRMSGDSTAATLAQALRVQLTAGLKRRMTVELARLRRTSHGVQVTLLPSVQPWADAGAVTPLHALSSLGISFLDGTRLPGYGDEFTVHVQYSGYSQSFRAVWDVGNWEAGGITLPQGESGEPGSGHYTDQAGAWVQGRLWPLPFSDAAVQRTAVQRETLQP